MQNLNWFLIETEQEYEKAATRYEEIYTELPGWWGADPLANHIEGINTDQMTEPIHRPT
ncbi:MAG: hypothetical protein V4594_20960 [Bacteroidota bacterium]